MTKWVITKYAAELRFEPQKGDVVEAAYPEPVETFDSLEAAGAEIDAAAKRNEYCLETVPRTCGSGKYWECVEYALEEWEYDDEDNLDQGRIVRILG